MAWARCTARLWPRRSGSSPRWPAAAAAAGGQGRADRGADHRAATEAAAAAEVVAVAAEDAAADGVRQLMTGDRFGIGWRPAMAPAILRNLDRIDVVELMADDLFD